MEFGIAHVFIFLLLLIAIIALVIILIYNDINEKLRLKLTLTCENNIVLQTPDLTLFPTVFDKAEAYNLMILSLQITFESGCNRLYDPPEGFVVIPIQGYDTFAGFTRHFGNYLYSKTLGMGIVVFSGTIYPSEWYDDANIKQIAPTNLGNYSDGVLVHDGFYEIYNSMRDAIQKLLIELPPTKQFIISGHSLGAALATLCYFDLQSTHHSTILYSFAAPRVGNIPFASFLSQQSQIYRVFNTEDLIPDLPPPIISNLIYEHNSNNIAFTNNLETYNKNHTTSYLEFLNSPTI